MLPVMLAAERLDVSPKLIHVWIQQGVVRSEQRTRMSYRWVELTEADMARLDGKHDWSQFPTVRQVMGHLGCTRAAVWAMVRAGQYVAYRQAAGQCWEWRLQMVVSTTGDDQAASVV